MKRMTILCALALAAALILPATERAADVQVFYPTAIDRSDDGTEIRKMYDLGPDDDPAGIPRSDFEQGGFHYALTDLLKQEMNEFQERQYTETVTLESSTKDMEAVLSLLPMERETITEDGFSGILTLRLDSVRVEVAGYGSSTKAVTATRNYPDLAGQDTSCIPKTIQDDGRTMTLQSIDWQTDSTVDVDGYAVPERYTAVATYTGTITNSYVKGYIVTADYSGTVSRIALDRVRYVAIFEGTPIMPIVTVPEQEPASVENESVSRFKWAHVLAPLGVIAAAGAGIGGALLLKRKQENEGGNAG